MSATVFEINGRFRPTPAAWVSVNDFELTAVDTIDPEVVMTSPNMSLYCLDHANRQFMFVETPNDVDLTQHPFFFQAQFKQAQRLIGVPYDVMHKMAAKRPFPDQKLILLYSVGRCGSTLLSETFNQLDGVVSLSEPDVFTDILKMREANGHFGKRPQSPLSAGCFDTELKQLLHSSLFALMKPLGGNGKRPFPSAWAIKFRSYCVELADLIYEVAPNATSLFMYRNAEDWARSTARAFQKLESEKGSVGTAVERKWAQRAAMVRPWLPKKLFNRFDEKAGVLSQRMLTMRQRFFPLIAEYVPQLRRGDLSRMEYITLEWLSAMHRYLELHKQGVPMLAFQYEALIEHPKPMLQAILEYCHLPTDDIDDLLTVFEHDSQRGTSLARTAVSSAASNQLTDDHFIQMRQLLKNHPDLSSPHVILPDTLAPTLALPRGGRGLPPPPSEED